MKNNLTAKLAELEKQENTQRDTKLFNAICEHYGCDLVVDEPYKIGVSNYGHQDTPSYWVLGWYTGWEPHRLYFIDQLAADLYKKVKDDNRWYIEFEKIIEIEPLSNIPTPQVNNK